MPKTEYKSIRINKENHNLIKVYAEQNDLSMIDAIMHMYYTTIKTEKYKKINKMKQIFK